MLKKAAAGAGAVLIVLCWPFATGQVGERIYLDTVGKYDSPYVSITSESYDRGYLSSDVVSRVEIKDAFKPFFEEEGLPTVWHIDSKMTHGVFGISSESQLVLDDDLKPIAAEIWGKDVSPITFTASTALTRKTDFTITVNPMSYVEELGAKADTSALVLKGVVDAKGYGEFEYALPEAKLTTTANEAMVLTDLSGSAKGILDGQFWIGKQDFALKSVSFVDQINEMQVSLEDMRVGMSNVLTQADDKASDTNDQIMTNTNTATIGKIVSLNGDEFTNLNFKLAFSDLNYSALSRLGDMADDLNENMTQAQAQEAALALDLLVAKGLKVQLEDLSVTAPQGDVSSNITLDIAPGLARASENMAKISEKLSGQINLILPQAIVDEDPILLERAKMMEQGGVVVLEDGNYKLQMQIKGDQIVLASGDQLPIAMLMMLFM
ncbi:DUF945 domain-containing protein [Photobacterium profundum]|uniref:DUF945 domain-containing protein n=1 Tax=Photobacterium profundum 3TCK TaxID=314280 RepID=Q1Z0X7_9GAMM|nr:DUF945 family protein [Photobacterium profundum]EAS42142.1 hypothetical protein P3TCK_16924 [Photobacterium profundum 3TCK]PSV64304.1 DUF945 domain-containing protein [Photobacterium profundum]